MKTQIKNVWTKFVYNPLFKCPTNTGVEHPIVIALVRVCLLVLLFLAFVLGYFGKDITSWLLMAWCIVSAYTTYQYLYEATHLKA